MCAMHLLVMLEDFRKGKEKNNYYNPALPQHLSRAGPDVAREQEEQKEVEEIQSPFL